MEHMEDENEQNIQISNAADWVKFNNPIVEKT